jgi:hypothetical protein|tara:strand:+ start:226 stop:354 length:129 start_codon:yes stop_codon:yes gene_type:complete
MSKTSAKGRYTQLMSWLKGYKSSPVSNFKKQQQKSKNNAKRR